MEARSLSEPDDRNSFSGGDDTGGPPTKLSPLVVQAPLLTLGEHAALEQAPKLSDRPIWDVVKDVAGKVWNSPNTGLGLLYGGAGRAVGEVGRLLGRQRAPGVRWRDNAVQFTNNPFGGVGALTLGNTTTYRGDPYDPKDPYWYPKGEDPRTIENGHSIGEHEEQHTIQGQQLGPLYVPSNIAGGVMGLLFDRDRNGDPDWHGPHNWNETGPQENPPTPWPRERR